MRIGATFGAIVFLTSACLAVGLPGRQVGFASTLSRTNRLLYNASFGAKFGGGVPGFRESKGILSYDGSGDTSLIVPFRTKHRPNFAVELRIRALGISGSNVAIRGYGITVRQSTADESSGIFAGSFFSDNAIFDNPLILWGDDSVGGAVFDPKTSWQVYRLEVKDTRYRLLIDKKPMVSFVISDFRTDTEIGIFSSFVHVQIKSFKVYALASSAAPVALPPVKQFDVQAADVPAGFQANIGHYFTNQEVGQESQVPVSTVSAAGRIVSYEVAFDSSSTTGMFYLSGAVTAYTGSDAARSDYQVNVASDVKELSGSSNTSNVQQSTSSGLGDESTLFSFDYTSQGESYRGYVLTFTRGTYRGVVTADFVPGTDPNAEAAQVVSVAHAVDARLQQKP
jgi:hypothetical protein